jgi:hypothetical protein
MVTCPNCNQHRLSVWERMSLSNYTPSECPRCKELFVNTTGAELLGLLVWVSIMAGLVFLADGQIAVPYLLAITVPLAFPARALFSRPIPYKTFRPYGRRAWWKNVLIFGVIPLALIVGIFFAAVWFGAGV